MKRSEFETRCACGAKFKFMMPKPSVMLPSIRSINCPDCKTSYLLSGHVVKGKWPRKFKIETDIISMSEKLKSIIKKRLLEKQENENG